MTSAPSTLYKMISVEDAQSIILRETQTLPCETVPLSSACRRILGEKVIASEAVPGYRASIKDGYAVHSSDGPGTYPVAFSAHAGTVSHQTLAQGSVAYIGTGGPVPEGADAVVQVEDTAPVHDGDPSTVHINVQVSSGCDIRPVGSDIAVGEPALTAGDILNPAEVGILATLGTTSVSVYQRPHVAVLTTGDEVCEPITQQLLPGQVRDANRAMLCAAAAHHGALVTDLGIVKDSYESVETAVEKAMVVGADVLLTTGGVSMGEKDYIKSLLERKGTVYFGKIRMKPGKPLTFAKMSSYPHKKSLLVFGLPGNPVSSLVTFSLAVVPCLRKLEGWRHPELRRIKKIKICSDIKMDPERPEYHRAVVRWRGDGLVATSTGVQASSRLLSARSANVLLEIPQSSGILPAGSVVSGLIVGDLGAMPVFPDE